MNNATKSVAGDMVAHGIKTSSLGHAFIALLVGIGTMAYAAMQSRPSITFSGSLGLATTFFVGAAIFFRNEDDRPGSGWSVMAFYGRSMVAQSMALLIVSMFAANWGVVAFAFVLALITEAFSRSALRHLFDQEPMSQKDNGSTRTFLTVVTLVQTMACALILHLLFR